MRNREMPRANWISFASEPEFTSGASSREALSYCASRLRSIAK